MWKMICAKIKDSLVRIFHLIEFTIRYLIRNFQTRNSDSLGCLVGKTAIVTGGNEGVGYGTSALLASRGCKVIIACRSDASESRDAIIGTTGNPNIEFRKLDLASLKSVREFSADIKRTEKKIDILINNAGAGALARKVTEDGLNAMMQTNFFGAFLLTHLLVEPMKASKDARVIFLSSGMGFYHNLSMDNLNITDFESDVWSSYSLYSNSKFCNILAGQEFGKRLAKYGIKANSADSGSARTDIYKKANQAFRDWRAKLVTKVICFAGLEKFDGAQTSFHLSSSKKLQEETGQHYFRCKRFLKPIDLRNQEFCDDIWRKTEELVQLKPDEKL